MRAARGCRASQDGRDGHDLELDTRQILALREQLIAEQVTCLVMEATGDYWKPFYYLLEDIAGVEVVLVNARHVKTLPGRKTDVADATWLAQLGAHGLVRGSFVPPEPIRQLRDLTRARTAITRERGREVQRLEKLLEDAGIKLSAVASDIMGGVISRRRRPPSSGRTTLLITRSYSLNRCCLDRALVAQVSEPQRCKLRHAGVGGDRLLCRSRPVDEFLA